MEMETLRNSVNYISILCSQYKFIKTVRKNVKFSNTQTSGPLNFVGDPFNLFFEVLQGPEKSHETQYIFDPALSLSISDKLSISCIGQIRSIMYWLSYEVFSLKIFLKLSKSPNFIIIKFWIQCHSHLNSSKHNNVCTKIIIFYMFTAYFTT